jgi:hypothetical protein
MPKPRSLASAPRNGDNSYAAYLRLCRRIGVRPQPPEQAKAQIETWLAALAARQEPPAAQNGPDATHRDAEIFDIADGRDDRAWRVLRGWRALHRHNVPGEPT